jgi:hypothetical protein
MSTARADTKFFVRNEDGRGFRPTARRKQLLLVWDVSSWVFIAIVAGVWISQGSVAWWLLAAAIPFAVAPWVAAMFFSGRGPIGALLYYGRRRRGTPQ